MAGGREFFIRNKRSRAHPAQHRRRSEFHGQIGNCRGTRANKIILRPYIYMASVFFCGEIRTETVIIVIRILRGGWTESRSGGHSFGVVPRRYRTRFCSFVRRAAVTVRIGKGLRFRRPFRRILATVDRPPRTPTDVYRFTGIFRIFSRFGRRRLSAFALK